MANDQTSWSIQDADVSENEIIARFPQVLEQLLRDHTTDNNIFWATDNYKTLGPGYTFENTIIGGISYRWPFPQNAFRRKEEL